MDFHDSELARLRAGDVGALESCYRVFGRRVRRLCRSLLGPNDADDATQEVFVRVFERARQFSGRARFSTWIYRLTVNHCLHRLERERRRGAEPLSDENGSSWERALSWTDDALRAVDDRDAVEKLLGELNPEQRTALTLREIEGLDYREIADVLDVPIGTVMSRLNRARQRLIELADASRAHASWHRISTP